MPNQRFVELAVDSLAATLAAGLATQLRAIEAAQSLTPNSITDPVAVVAARIPADNRSPLVAVYEEGFSTISQRQEMIAVNCTVVISAVSQTAANLTDIAALVRRYTTAIIQVIQLDPTLATGGAPRGLGARVTDGDAAAALGDQSSTRLVATVGVEVRVHSP